MNNTNRNKLLDTLRLATGVIDKIAYIQQGSNLAFDFKDADWKVASDGVLENNTVMDFTNNTGATVYIIGVGLFSSGAQTLTSGATVADSAVKVDNYSSAIEVQDGETFRLENYDYTIN